MSNETSKEQFQELAAYYETDEGKAEYQREVQEANDLYEKLLAEAKAKKPGLSEEQLKRATLIAAVAISARKGAREGGREG